MPGVRRQYSNSNPSWYSNPKAGSFATLLLYFQLEQRPHLRVGSDPGEGRSRSLFQDTRPLDQPRLDRRPRQGLLRRGPRNRRPV